MRTALRVLCPVVAAGLASLVSCARLERPTPVARVEPKPIPVVAAPAPVAPPSASVSLVAKPIVDPAAAAEAQLEAAGVASAEPLEAQPPTEEPLGPMLVATLKETWIYTFPDFASQKLGYLRAGAVVARGEKPSGHHGCKNGWYKIEPRGYVCVGLAASLDPANPIAELAKRRPDRSAGLPYAYGLSRFPTPPFYLKVPTTDEQRMVEGEVLGASAAFATEDGDKTVDELPIALQNGRIVPSVTPNHHGPGALFEGRAVPRSGFALISQFESGGRRFGLTTDFQIVPLARMRNVVPSSFHGMVLEETGLPAVFVRSKSEHFSTRDPKTGALTAGGPIGYREGIPLSGKSEKIGKSRYWETRDGRWVRDSNDSRFVRLDPPKEWPSWAVGERRWIDVSILKQSLVAYEGKKPIYATLVSTGADGLGDPKETHSTVRGTFLIHTKHVTATMDSDAEDEVFDLRDVPYVQYFYEGYALHAAYWHDDFGIPKSHGCVNLHPTDAAWLFSWTDPPVPDEWHGALSVKEGTLVYIHP